MAEHCVRFSAKLVVVVLLPLILPGTFSAQRDREIGLFVEPLNSQGVAATSGDRRLLRTRFADVNLDLLSSQVEGVPGRPVEVRNIRLNLFDDTSFTAVPDRIEATGTDSFAWTGHLEGIELSGVTLVVRDGVLAGNITIPGTSYELRYVESGVYSVNQIDPTAFPPEAPPIPVDIAPTFAPIAGDDGSIVDVMVVYTTTARQAAGGTGAMNALIALAVSESNAGYGNSNVTQRLRLVHTAEVNYSEAGFDWITALNRLTNTSDGFMDEVHTLRDTYGADAVVLIVNNTAFCGLAWLMTTVSDGFKTNAFSLVSRPCAAGNYTFAHELGHNMGSHHDRANASGPAAFPYSYGYQAPDAAFRTIMAYNCEGLGCPRVNYWSNPEVFFGGQPMGVEHTLPDAADNRRSLNNTAFTVANWRNSAPAAAKAQITSPQPGSTLNSSTVTFTWNTGSGVSQYWLDVGTTLGGTQIYSQSQGTNLSVTVGGLPTNGSTVYVRLWSLIGGVWQFNDYTYTAASGGGGVKAAITSPVPGSTLTSSTVTFAWNTGSGVAEYWLEIGTSFGGTQIYSQSQGTNLSVTVSGLPANGSTVYVRLWSRISGVWQFNDYTYTAASGGGAVKAEITSPTPGSTLGSSTVTFAWNTGSGVAEYWLEIGTSVGGTQIYSQSQGTNLSVTVSGLPANGSTVYVRLWSRISGVWQFNDYTYTAASGGGGVNAAITSPIPGSTLTSSTVTFFWNTGAGVSEYWLEIGTTFAGNQLYSQSQGTNLSVTVSGLPTNGSTLYVRLWSRISGVWQFNDYVYIAATQ
jgi:Metallo-peptidase family M12